MSDEQRPEGFYWMRWADGWDTVNTTRRPARSTAHGDFWLDRFGDEGNPVQWGDRIPTPDESTVHIAPPHTVKVDMPRGLAEQGPGPS